MCDRIPVDVLARFVIEAVELSNSSRFRINQRDTGSGRCEPRTLLAVLIYCYAIGTFRSRRIKLPAGASHVCDPGCPTGTRTVTRSPSDASCDTKLTRHRPPVDREWLSR